jgi:hypothetical protein
MLYNKDVPTKAAMIAFALCIVGVILLIVGIAKGLDEWNTRIVLVYCVAGMLFSIPGFYFSCKICKAYKTKDKLTRRGILGDIPDM